MTIRIYLWLVGGPHDQLMLDFTGACRPEALTLLSTGKVKIEHEGELYRIAEFDELKMRGVGVWESERVLTE